MNRRSKIGHGYTASFIMRDGSILRSIDDNLTHSITPELYDIAITNYCPNNCDYCYMNSDMKGSQHMSLKDLEYLFENQLDRHHNILPFQVVLGGGEPILHPQFIEILRYIRSLDIVPNYTTSGIGLSDAIIKATADYCGGIGLTYHKHVSGEKDKEFRKVLERLSTIRHKVTVNVHIIVGRDNLTDISHLMNTFSSKFDHLVLQSFKPLGRGADQDVRLFDDAAKDELLSIAKKYYKTGRLAFDAGLIPFFTSYYKELGMSVDQVIMGMPTLEARYNAFIDTDLNLKPSNFYSGEGISLRDTDLIEAWQESALFTDVRSYQNNPSKECLSCEVFEACRGGIYDPDLPAINRVNFCKHKKFEGASPFDL